MESAILSDDIDEEEVWLYWIDSNKEPHGKAIRHLAQEAKEGTKADPRGLDQSHWVNGDAISISPVNSSSRNM